MAENSVDPSDADQISRIKDRIATLVKQRFATGANTYYLSQLGNELLSDRQLLEKLTKGRLSDFIRSEFDFEIGKSGAQRNVLYLLQPGTTSSALQDLRPNPPRYNSRFWAAFAVPILDGESRFLGLQNFTFGPDKKALRKTEMDVLEIKQEYVTPQDASRSPGEIAGQIARWLDDNEFTPGRFLTRCQRFSHDAMPSVLEQLLGALDEEQLKRVSLPLDIIQTLSKNSVR